MLNLHLDGLLSTLAGQKLLAQKYLGESATESIIKLKEIRANYKTHEVHPKMAQGVAVAFELAEQYAHNQTIKADEN